MSTKKRGWRTLWLGILIALGLLVTIPIAAVLFLRSEAGSKFLVGKLKEVLAQSEIAAPPNRFEFSEGRIDPFSGFHFRDVDFSRHQDGLNLEFSAAQLEIKYGFSLLSRRIEIEKFYVERPRLSLRMETAADKTQSPEATEASGSFDEFIMELLAEVLIRKAVIKGLEARIEMTTGAQKSVIEIANADLSFGFESVAKRLATKGRFKTGQPVKMKSGDFSFEAMTSAQWEVLIAREGEKWVYRLKPLELDLAVSNLIFEQRASNVKANLPDLNLKLNSALFARSDTLLALDGNAVEEIEVQGQGEARDLRVEMEVPKAVREIRQQNFAISVRLKDDIEFRLQHIFAGLVLPETFKRPVEAKLEAQGQVDRKLTKANIKAATELSGHRLLDLSSEAQRIDGKIDLTGQARLEFKPELSRIIPATESLKALGPFLLETEFSIRSHANDVLKSELRARVPAIKPPVINERLSFALSSEAVWNRLQNRAELESDLRVQALDQNAQLALTSRATANLTTKDIQARLELNAETAERKAGAGRFGGRIRVPANLSVYGGHGVTVNGELDLNDVRFETDAWAVQGVSGRIPFTEKLLLKNSKIAFEHLLRLNPFERADFDRVRPLLSGNVPVRIENLRWEEKTYGPFIGFFSIRQNRISVHQFHLDIGSGRVYGEMFFDAHPSELQFGVLSRLTALQLGEVLPKRYLRRLPADTGRLGGRTGLIINLNRSSIDGRLDITEIGGPQLIAMVNLLDPDFEDEKMNKVRQLLEHGYPTSVGLSFGKGYMDMDIALNLLGLEVRESVREIPVSALLSSATADLLKQVKKGPIE